MSKKSIYYNSAPSVKRNHCVCSYKDLFFDGKRFNLSFLICRFGQCDMSSLLEDAAIPERNTSVEVSNMQTVCKRTYFIYSRLGMEYDTSNPRQRKLQCLIN